MKRLVRWLLRLLLWAGLLCIGFGIWIWATTLGKGGTDFEYSAAAYYAFSFGAIVIGLMAAAIGGAGLGIFRELEANRRSRDGPTGGASPRSAPKHEGGKDGPEAAHDPRE